MKIKYNWVLSFFFLFYSLAISQEFEDDVDDFADDCIELMFLNNHLYNQSIGGFSLGFTKELSEYYYIGIYFGAHWKKINPTPFDVVDPHFRNADVGILFKNAFIKEKNYNFKSFLNLSWSMSSVIDRSIILEIGFDTLEYELIGYNSFLP